MLSLLKAGVTSARIQLRFAGVYQRFERLQVVLQGSNLFVWNGQANEPLHFWGERCWTIR